MALSSILPGLREVRAPLLAGYLYLLLIWLFWGDDLRQEQKEGVIGDLVELGQSLPAVALLAVVSVVAYLLGSLIDSVRANTGGILDRAFGGAFRLSGAGRERIQDLLEEVEADARERLSEVGLPLDHPTVRELPTAAELVRETDEIRDSLVGEQPERLAEVDRHRSESELRAALMIPVAILAIALANDHGAIWLIGVAAAAGMAIQAFTRMRTYNEGVIGVLIRDKRSGRERPATSPALLDFEQSVEESVRAKREADEARAQLHNDELAFHAMARLTRLVMRESDRADRRGHHRRQQGLRRLLGFPLDTPARGSVVGAALEDLGSSAAAVLRERGVLHESEEELVRVFDEQHRAAAEEG